MCRREPIAETTWADPARAMSHAGNQKQAIETVDFRVLASGVGEALEERTHALVIVDRTNRRDRCIAPAMMLNQFAAIRAKRTQIRVRGIEHGPGFRVAKRDVPIEIQRSEIPVRLLEDRVPVIGIAKARLYRRRLRIRRYDPRHPSSGNRFGANRKTRKDLLAGPRIDWAAIDSTQCRDLSFCETVGSIVRFTNHGARIEVARSWVFDEPIFHAVQRIAHSKRRRLDGR